MPMAGCIIVDGYNLIGSEKGLRGNLQSQRDMLIRDLHKYQERKGYVITVVFDGWRAGWIYETEERSGDLTVIYSRQGEKADSVIKRLAQEIGSACIVVTSDRELRQAVEASGATAIYTSEFKAKLDGSGRTREVIEQPSYPLSGHKKGNARRLPKRERKRRERLKGL